MKFLVNMPSRRGEMAVVCYDKDNPGLEVWDVDGWATDLTQNIVGITLEEGEVAINHDLFFKPYLPELMKYIGQSSREVKFGPWGTKTLVVKLKENWKELCVMMGG